LDRVVALIVLLICCPIMLIVALVIYMRMGSPIFFTQERPGQDGRIFTIYKFRTMTNEQDEEGKLLSDEQRLTVFGQFLRKTSLDEVPQMWNVLKGDMSLIGPRPLLVQYLERYNSEQARRHEVLPGITGWAQVNGRCDIDWPDKFKLDVWYVDNWSLWLDLKILFLTIGQVLRQKDISQEGHVTGEEFLGNS